MDLTLDTSDSLFSIRAFSPGELIINENHLFQSVVLTPTQCIHPWPPQTIAALAAEHLTVFETLSPQILLLGTGMHWTMVPYELLMPLYARNIGVEIMDTAAACRTFNVLAAEGRQVAAGLIIK